MTDDSVVLVARFHIVTAPLQGEEHANTIVIVPSSAFGDGRHETTQMCLQAIVAFAPRDRFRLLDVGSGSGILSIAAAKLGAEATGIDIDAGANAVATENARLNGVADRTAFGTAWPNTRFDVVIANILRRVLLDRADDLVARVAPAGVLILSGLVSTDTPELVARFTPLLAGTRPEIFERDPWRTLVWHRVPAPPLR